MKEFIFFGLGVLLASICLKPKPKPHVVLPKPIRDRLASNLLN